jgi:hypothetical protein
MNLHRCRTTGSCRLETPFWRFFVNTHDWKQCAFWYTKPKMVDLEAEWILI